MASFATFCIFPIFLQVDYIGVLREPRDYLRWSPLNTEILHRGLDNNNNTVSGHTVQVKLHGHLVFSSRIFVRYHLVQSQARLYLFEH